MFLWLSLGTAMQAEQLLDFTAAETKMKIWHE